MDKKIAEYLGKMNSAQRAEIKGYASGLLDKKKGANGMNENKLEVFQNQEFGSIRMVEIDGEAWMVGKDVAQALGYKNPQEAIRNHVDEEDKGVREILTPRRETADSHHQRKRALQSGAIQQAAERQKVPALGDQRSDPQHQAAWGVHDPGNTASGNPEP